MLIQCDIRDRVVISVGQCSFLNVKAIFLCLLIVLRLRLNLIVKKYGVLLAKPDKNFVIVCG
jgi:hypothetical protein